MSGPTRWLQHDALRDTGLARRGGEAGAQAVAAEGRAVIDRQGHGGLDGAGNIAVTETRGVRPVGPGHRAEEGGFVRDRRAPSTP